MKRTLRTLTATAALGLLAIIGCGPKPPDPVPDLGGQTRMENTQANLDKCDAEGGTATRDPQPPRPTSDPGPYFICVWP